jgi:RHS repeat-associated protein
VHHIVYDGWRVIQERNSANTPAVSYTRGNDLSVSPEGAGGIGGLLARSHGYSSGNWTTHNFYHADGNGNITYLVNSSQTVAASYRYDPFGNTTSSSGTLSGVNVYRFSSKETISWSGMYYYGYRFYDPNLQRWMNRDPIEEDGDLNLYRFVANKPLGVVDSFGLSPPTFPPAPGTYEKGREKLLSVRALSTRRTATSGWRRWFEGGAQVHRLNEANKSGFWCGRTQKWQV